jgi:hypothetical protein
MKSSVVGQLGRRLPVARDLWHDVRAVWRARRNGAARCLRLSEAGNFYSPIPNSADRVCHEQAMLSDQLDGIDLRVDAQRRLLRTFFNLGFRIPLPQPHGRFHVPNTYFSYGDAEILTGMILHFKPKRIIEVGSGFSTALMLDISEHYHAMDIACIEPFPHRLRSLTRPTDKFELMQAPAQQVSSDYFASLERNDILFIDSTHVAKAGSDVLHLFFRVIPRLKPGVIIHVHDVFWKFDYPAEWHAEGFAWNEAYFVRALLMHSSFVEILYFNAQMCRDPEIEQYWPAAFGKGQSLWLGVKG